MSARRPRRRGAAATERRAARGPLPAPDGARRVRAPAGRRRVAGVARRGARRARALRADRAAGGRAEHARRLADGRAVGRRTRMTVTPATATMLEEGGERIFGFGPEHEWDGRWLVVVLRIPEDRRGGPARGFALGSRAPGSARSAAASGSPRTPIASRSSRRRCGPRARPTRPSRSWQSRARSGRQSDLAAAWDLAELGRGVRAASSDGSALQRADRPSARRPSSCTDGAGSPSSTPTCRPSCSRGTGRARGPTSLFRRRNAAWHADAQAHFAALDGAAVSTLNPRPRRSE